MSKLKKLHNQISNLFGDANPIVSSQNLDQGYQFIANLLPYRFFDSESHLFFNQNSIGFILEAIPLTGASDDVIDTITGTITDGLPEGCTVQFINWASPKTADILREWQEPRNKVGGIYQKLAEKRVEYFYNANFKSIFATSPFTIKDFRLFISVSVPVNKGSDFISKAISKISNNDNEEIEIIRIIDKLKSLQDQLKTTFRTIGIHSYLMNAKELISFLDEIININTSPEKSDIKYDPLNTINRQIVDLENHLQVDENNLTFFADNNEKQIKARCFSIKNYPTIWAQWQCRDLIGDYFQDLRKMEYPFLTSFAITVPANETSLQAKASAKNFNATRMADTPIAKFLPEIRTKAQEWQFVTSKTNAGQKILKTIYQVIVFAPPNKINEAEQTIKSIYKANGWDLSRDKYINLQSFLATIPFTLSEGLFDDLEKMGRVKTMVSWTCANLAPMQAEWKGMDSKMMMLFGRRGQPLFWNPFANKDGNYNTAVIGKSGSGKSVFMQELVASIRGFGGKVYVIDDGRSFMNSCRLQGGEFVEFSDASNICLNPFSIISKEQMEKSQEYKGEVINLIKAMVKQMCKSIEHITDYENGLIEEAVNQAWEEHQNLANITIVRDIFANHKDKRANDLATMIRPFTKDGNYGKLFEGQSNIKLTNPLMVFELAEIKNKKDLQAIVLMFLMFLVSENMYFGDRKTPISLVIDEAWDLLHGEGSKTFIEGLARRARKYSGNIITGTQSMNDYYKTPATIAAIENTDWIILLAQKKESIEALAQTKRIVMDDYLKQNLVSLRMIDHQYSEALIYGPRGWAVGRLMLDPFSIALYSSKAEDFAKIDSLTKQGLSLEDALEKIVNQKKL